MPLVRTPRLTVNASGSMLFAFRPSPWSGFTSLTADGVPADRQAWARRAAARLVARGYRIERRELFGRPADFAVRTGGAT